MDFTLFPVLPKENNKQAKQNDFIFPWPTPYGKTQLVERSQSKSLNESTHCFNGTYTAACVPFGVIACISLAASRWPVTPSPRRLHPGKLTTRLLSPTKCSFSKASRKLFLLFQYFLVASILRKGGGGAVDSESDRGRGGKNKTSERTTVYLAGLTTNAQKAPRPNPL